MLDWLGFLLLWKLSLVHLSGWKAISQSASHHAAESRSCWSLRQSSCANLKWNLHYDNIISNGNKSLGFLKRNLTVSNTDIKSRAYQALVRPKLEYGCSVWDPHTNEYKKKIEMVQSDLFPFEMMLS
jgi:hypothetical protein